MFAKARHLGLRRQLSCGFFVVRRLAVVEVVLGARVEVRLVWDGLIFQSDVEGWPYAVDALVGYDAAEE